MALKKDKLYICFHKPKGLLGYLITLRTFGKYAHCEMVLNDYVYYTNPGGARIKPFIYKSYMDIYEINLPFSVDYFIEQFKKYQGKGYDYWAIVLSQLLELDIEDKERYFCSELCLILINKLMDDSLTYNLKSIKANQFSPSKLYKYLKFMEIIGEKEW